MFSERLDKLILSSLQDGILTDQEKAAIIKRAKAEGEDIDEVEIYIDSLLQKRQKELNKSAVKKQANVSNMDELKKLIDAAMADGIITSKEREVIIRKAAAFGIDASEVEIYLDAEIQKAEQAADMVKRDKIGPVCPKCGKQVPPLTVVCECGYEFAKKESVSSVQELFDKIELIMNEPIKYSKVDGEEPNLVQMKSQKSSIMKERRQRIMNLISMFPVPNTKEDIVEFLSLAAPKSIKKGGIMGSVMGRLSIFIPILVVIIILVFFLTPRTYVEDVYDGFFSTSTHQEIRQTSIGGIITAIIFIGTPVIIALAYLLDRNTLQWNEEANVWKAKFDQVLMKGRSLRGDSDFQQQLDYYENMLNK